MKTLVLNADYKPLTIIDWQRAITLYFMDKVEIVKSDPSRQIRSPNLVIDRPTVVRLKSMVTAVYKRSVRFNRTSVYLRDKGICQYCGRYVPRNKATIDHVVPKSAGGATNFLNCVTCCYPCNQYKNDLTPREAGMSLLRPPYKPSFLPIDLSEIKFQEHWREWLNENDFLEEIDESLAFA